MLAGTDPGFLGGGRQPQGGTAPNHFSAVSLQLHENENFTRRALPKFDYVDPALYKLHVLPEKKHCRKHH